MGKISDRIAAKAAQGRNGKVVSTAAVRAARKAAKEMADEIASVADLIAHSYDPLHAIYVSAQNHMSVLAGAISALPQFDRCARVVADAEDTYMPSGPPFSPLTPSFYSLWVMCDLRLGKGSETMGSWLVELVPTITNDPLLAAAVSAMHASRMGLYEHQGVKDGRVVLRDRVTGRGSTCTVPAGYLGSQGELWFARVLPPLDERHDHSVVMTTPYVLLDSNAEQWQAFFARQGKAIDKAFKDVPKEQRLEHFLKFGLDDNYWNEYVFRAYVNSTDRMIWLTGLPDAPKSLPHA